MARAAATAQLHLYAGHPGDNPRPVYPRAIRLCQREKLDLVVTRESMTPHFTIDGAEYRAHRRYYPVRGIPTARIRCVSCATRISPGTVLCGAASHPASGTRHARPGSDRCGTAVPDSPRAIAYRGRAASGGLHCRRHQFCLVQRPPVLQRQGPPTPLPLNSHHAPAPEIPARGRFLVFMISFPAAGGAGPLPCLPGHRLRRRSVLQPYRIRTPRRCRADRCGRRPAHRAPGPRPSPHLPGG